MKLLAFLSAFTILVSPQLAKAPEGFVHSVTRSDSTLVMQTAAKRYTAAGKPDVWLIGAVHIGTKAYYASLQELLDKQSAVFFEGVRGGPKPPAPKPGEAPVKPVYEVLGDALNLRFQQQEISYNRPNWTNVDLSWEDMEKINGPAEKGGQLAMVKSLLDPTSPLAQAFSSMMAIATPGTKEAIKLMMIQQSGADQDGITSPELRKVVLEARNKVVVDALAKQLALPNPPATIGILYGAAHMSGIGSELTKQFGYKPAETKWFSSAVADPKKVDAMGQSLLDQMKASAKATKPPVRAGH